MNNFSNFLAIRAAYAEVLPEWFEDYEATGRMCNDPYIMDWKFTPIERNVWSDIRNLGLPLYPQLPALNYFLDFGNPFLKIGVECDGKAWHDADQDRIRDARLAAAGWMIFRIEGHECMRIVDIPERSGSDDECQDAVDMGRFFASTSEGILQAIKQAYFSDRSAGIDQYYIDSTLFEHRSTPETFPVRRPLMQSATPTLLCDLIPEYLKLLQRRQARAA